MAVPEPTENRRAGTQAKRLRLIKGLRSGKTLEAVMADVGYSLEHRSRLRHDPEIRAIEREVHGNKFLDMVPYALRALKECLESPNERVKADMSKFVLKESGVLEELKNAEREGRQPTQGEIVAAMSRLEGLMEGAKKAQERDEQVIEHEPDQ